MRIARHANRQQAGAKRFLAEDKRRAPSGAALLAVGIGEERAFFGDAINVGRPVAHQPHRVGADLRDADVIAEDDEDVGFSTLRASGGEQVG